MKLVYVITQGGWGGAQAHVFDLISSAVQLNNQIWLICGSTGRLTDEIKHIFPKVHVIVLDDLCREVSFSHDLKAVMYLRRIFRRVKPDIIHLHSAKAGTIGRIAAYHISPVIYTVHGWAFTTGVSKKRALLAIAVERVLQPLTARYICVSKFDYNLGIKKGLMNKRHPGTVIHNGVRKEVFQHSLIKKHPTIVMAARFDVPKRQDLLIRALEKISDKSLHLILLGDGPKLLACQELANNLNIENRVHFLGSVTNVREYYADADIVMLISDYEALPISIIEGLASAKPIIASNVGGINELIQNNGFLVANSVNEIVQCVQLLLENRNLRNDMGQKSFEVFQNEYTERKMLSKTFNLYNSVMQIKR